jgi:hypothetical protein
VSVLWGAMQEYESDFNFEEAADLFDRYIDNGHSFEELMREIDGILKTAGFYIKHENELKSPLQSNESIYET